MVFGAEYVYVEVPVSVDIENSAATTERSGEDVISGRQHRAYRDGSTVETDSGRARAADVAGRQHLDGFVMCRRTQRQPPFR